MKSVVSLLSQPIGRETAEVEAVTRCQDGDREAFGWIVDQYGDLLFGSAVLMTRDRQLAEDLVQETLLSAWKSIGSFRRDKRLKPWIMKILVNHVRMHMRRKRPATVDLRADSEQAAAAPEAARVELRHVLVTALGDLPQEQRQLIVLRYFAGLTVPEIAKATRLRQGTVKSRIHRGLERMKEAMTEEEAE